MSNERSETIRTSNQIRRAIKILDRKSRGKSNQTRVSSCETNSLWSRRCRTIGSSIWNCSFGDKTIRSVLSLTVVLIGITVIIGWHIDNPYITQIDDDWTSMKFQSAVSSMFAGFLFWVYSRNGSANKSQIFGSMCTMGLLLTQLGLTYGALTHNYTGIEAVMIQETHPAPYTVLPGQPSVMTMFSFLLIACCGIAWIFNRPQLIRILSLVVLIIGLIAVLGYIFDNPSLYWYRPEKSSAMALHSAVVFCLLGIVGCGKKLYRQPNTVQLRIIESHEGSNS